MKPTAMHFRHQARTTWMTKDDHDGHFLLAPGCAGEAGSCPAGVSRQRHGVCLENSSQQVVQVVQVVLTPFIAAFSCGRLVILSDHLVGQPVLWTLEAQTPMLPEVACSKVRSYALSVEVG